MSSNQNSFYPKLVVWKLENDAMPQGNNHWINVTAISIIHLVDGNNYMAWKRVTLKIEFRVRLVAFEMCVASHSGEHTHTHKLCIYHYSL